MAYKNFRCTEIIEEIGEELRRVRKQKKLTISHVAEQVSAASGLPVPTRCWEGSRPAKGGSMMRSWRPSVPFTEFIPEKS